MNAEDATPLINALRPILSRVRTDATALKDSSGKTSWTSTPLSRPLMAQHLNGGPARGVCPIKAGQSVTMLGLLDFDSHKGEVPWAEMSAVVGRVVDHLRLFYEMEPALFRSSGGQGVHLYLLWDEPQDAYSVRMFLADVLEACGLRDGTKGVKHGQVEVFPRQSSVPIDGFGNQVILPLAGKSVPLDLREVP